MRNFHSKSFLTTLWRARKLEVKEQEVELENLDLISSRVTTTNGFSWNCSISIPTSSVYSRWRRSTGANWKTYSLSKFSNVRRLAVCLSNRLSTPACYSFFIQRLSFEWSGDAVALRSSFLTHSIGGENQTRLRLALEWESLLCQPFDALTHTHTFLCYYIIRRWLPIKLIVDVHLCIVSVGGSNARRQEGWDRDPMTYARQSASENHVSQSRKSAGCILTKYRYSHRWQRHLCWSPLGTPSVTMHCLSACFVHC